MLCSSQRTTVTLARVAACSAAATVARLEITRFVCTIRTSGGACCLPWKKELREKDDARSSAVDARPWTTSGEASGTPYLW